MPVLKLRSKLNLVGSLPSVEMVTWTWTIPHSVGGKAIVSLVPSEKALEVAYEVDVSDELANLVGTQQQRLEGVPPDLRHQVYRVSRPELESTRKLLSHLVYTLGWSELNADELSSSRESGLHWSLDGRTWERVPSDIQITIGIGMGVDPLNEKTAANLQRRLDAGVEPLIARRHLHRAKAEQTPRFMWIDATIAAELAIKEFLIRWAPELEPLLLSLPSPPLDKLYGQVLEAYLGERSPHLKAIREGVPVRNRLVHDPAVAPPTEQESWDYVDLVAQAIEHLEHHLRKRALS